MRDKQCSLRMQGRMHAQIQKRLDGISFNTWVLDACSEKLRHAAESHKARYRELQVFSSGDSSEGNPVERRFDQLIQKNGLATHHAGGSSEMDKKLARVIRKRLTDVQYRRLMAHLRGDVTMEQIAHKDGASKQAVHASILAAKKLLWDDPVIRSMLVERSVEISFDEGNGTAGAKAIEKGGVSFDRMLELVCGGVATVGDISHTPGKFHPVLARAMKPILTAVQFRRFQAYMVGGRSLRQIAEDEDCSAPSVHRSIALARRRLRSSIPVCRALCQLYGDATGVEIDADAMVKAIQNVRDIVAA